MASSPWHELHELVDRLDDEQARRLAQALREGSATSARPRPRPLTEADIVLVEPVLPNDESADEMIATVRRWRREGGFACAPLVDTCIRKRRVHYSARSYDHQPVVLRVPTRRPTPHTACESL